MFQYNEGTDAPLDLSMSILLFVEAIRKLAMCVTKATATALHLEKNPSIKVTRYQTTSVGP